MPLATHTSAEVYRGPGYSHAELRAAALREFDGILGRSSLVRVLAARRARIALGAWLVACAALVPFAALLDDGESATTILIWAWLGAPLIWLAARGYGGLTGQRRLLARAESMLDGEVLSLESGARYHSRAGLEALLAQAGAREARSVGWLLAGTALLAPLGIHVLAAPILQGTFSFIVQPGRFTPWVRWSLILTMHAHLLLAWKGWKHGERVADAPDNKPPRDAYGLAALGWATLASAMPGIMLYGLPPLLVLVTGLAFVPATWRLTTRRAQRERVLLERAATA